MANGDFAFVFRRRSVCISAREVAVFSDSAFANAPGLKSQYGMIGCLADAANPLIDEDYNHTTPLWWSSATVKRVVSSTLAAGAYAISEGFEHATCARHLILDAMGQLNNPDRGLPITVFTEYKLARHDCAQGHRHE